MAGGLLCLALTGVIAEPQAASSGQTPVFGGMFSLWTSHCS
jgi:hypothetical protein